MFPLVAFTSIAIAAGYVAIVLMYLLVTFGMTALAPKFVMEKGQFTGGYLFVHPFIWAICGLVGGYVAGSIDSPQPILTSIGLGILIALLIVKNAGGSGSRQALRAKGMLATMAIVGIAGGSYLVLR